MFDKYSRTIYCVYLTIPIIFTLSWFLWNAYSLVSERPEELSAINAHKSTKWEAFWVLYRNGAPNIWSTIILKEYQDTPICDLHLLRL